RREFGRAYVSFALDRAGKYRVMLGPRVNETGRFPTLETAISQALSILVGEIDIGQKRGVFRSGPPEDLALTVWLTAHGYIDMVDRRRVRVKSRRVALEYFVTLLTPAIEGMRAPRS